MMCSCVLHAIGGSANANSYQFTGRENDGTSLYYYRARYYSPTAQRGRDCASPNPCQVTRRAKVVSGAGLNRSMFYLGTFTQSQLSTTALSTAAKVW
jgi:hypothetical protein